jgi:hypothetical protein
LPLDALRQFVQADEIPGEGTALEELVAGLARDGLVEVHEEQGAYIVRLPGAVGEQDVGGAGR